MPWFAAIPAAAAAASSATAGTAAVAAGAAASTSATLSAVALGVSAAGMGVSTYMQMQSASAQKRQAALVNARKQRESIAQARVAMGQAVNSSANQGAMNSSSAQGGQGSITSQMNSNLGFMSGYTAAGQQAADASMWAGISQDIFKIGALGYEYQDDIFGTGKK